MNPEPERIRNAGSRMVKNRSMCGMGFSVRRPASRAVGSPRRSATKPCAASWLVMDGTTTRMIPAMMIGCRIHLLSRSGGLKYPNADLDPHNQYHIGVEAHRGYGGTARYRRCAKHSVPPRKRPAA
jgi:hypothetical protein